jgi:vacuolar protein sorting-associated protein 54
VTSLDTVPAVFFDPDFSLVDPVTFALVTEQPLSRRDNGSLEQDPASISYSVPLLEKLSHYADTVEGHLVREIQDRSASFFSALTNLHDLQSESERCLRRITELKSMLTQVDEKGAKKGLELVREDMKVTQLTRLEDGVKLVKDVQDMKAIAQGLAGAGEWSDALNMIENLHALLEPTPQGPTPQAGETQRQNYSPITEEGEEGTGTPMPSPTRNTARSKLPTALRDVSLQKLQAFVSLPADLRILTTQIASTLSDDFAAVSQQDLILRAEESERRQSQGHTQADAEHALRERFVPMLTGLLRTGENGLKEGLEKWREVLMADVRSAVKKV